MNSDRFVQLIRQDVIESNLATYQELFRKTSPSEAKDDYWKRALFHFEKMDDSEQEVFFEIIRQVMVDTTSTILSILDGNSGYNMFGEVTLFADSKQLSGELQDSFLEVEELLKRSRGDSSAE